MLPRANDVLLSAIFCNPPSAAVLLLSCELQTNLGVIRNTFHQYSSQSTNRTYIFPIVAKPAAFAIPAMLSPSIRTLAARTTIRRPHPVLSALPYANHQKRLAQGYGSGEGDPAGEKPQEQGQNPEVDQEHPGPKAPDVGQKDGTRRASPDKSELLSH